LNDLVVVAISFSIFIQNTH